MLSCAGQLQQQPALELPEPAPFRGPKEYCYYETFDARCSDDEVILMTSALYGRMRFGRCVKTNFGFMGCFTDVLDLLDRRCSGRRSCSVEVVEPTFDGVRPCNKELKCYLEVDYRCIRSTQFIINFIRQWTRRRNNIFTNKPVGLDATQSKCMPPPQRCIWSRYDLDL